MLATLLATAACTFAAHGQLPDRGCTPGDFYDQVTNANVAQTICRRGWATEHRDVSSSLRASIYEAYGVKPPHPFPEWEMDHLIPLELGGSNARRNLWPEHNPARKDDIEDALHARVCAGRMRVTTAWRIFSVDWRRGQRYLPREPGR